MKLELVTNSEEFFIKALTQAYQKYPIANEFLVKPYLAQMLSKFLLSDNLLWGDQVRPYLFELLISAQSAPRTEQKNKYQYLGDVALFMGGVFPASLRRSLVGLDYYIDMGGAAYLQTAALETNSQLFLSLGQNFSAHLDLLGEVFEGNPSSWADLLQLLENYNINSSPRALKKLQALGVNPLKFTKKSQ